jgi:hypothetical protein
MVRFRELQASERQPAGAFMSVHYDGPSAERLEREPRAAQGRLQSINGVIKCYSRVAAPLTGRGETDILRSTGKQIDVEP